MIAQYFYTMLRKYTSNCFLAWSVFVWYAIKIDIRPRPVSILSDYSTIKENIYIMRLENDNIRRQDRVYIHLIHESFVQDYGVVFQIASK